MGPRGGGRFLMREVRMYRGTSLIKKRTPLGPYSRPVNVLQNVKNVPPTDLESPHLMSKVTLWLAQGLTQGYFPHTKQPPPPWITVRPLAYM